MTSFDAFVTRHPALTPLSAYVDDDSLHARGSPAEVRTALVDGAFDFAGIVQDELQVQIAPDKLMTVAMDKELARNLAKDSCWMAGKVSPAASNLGIDFAPGARRCCHGALTVRAK